MLGVYDPLVADKFWSNPYNRQSYRLRQEILSKPLPKDASQQQRRKRSELAGWMEIIRKARLINRLRHRRPDERIGYSLFVYRLSQRQVDEMVRP